MNVKPIYSSSSVLIWQKLAGSKTQAQYKAYQPIFVQGQKPTGLFFLEKGLIKLDYVSPQGQTHTLRFFKPGEVFGYRSFFAKDEYSASAIAVELSEVSFITYEDTMDIFTKHPEVAFDIMQVISRDLRRAEEKWTSQMDKDTCERIAEALLYFDSRFDRKNWTRREIAEWVGTTPETVIRTLALFEKNGLIDQSSGRAIKILEKDNLIHKSCELNRKV